MRIILLLSFCILINFVEGAPSIDNSVRNQNQQVSIQNVLTRNRVRNGELDPQTRNDLRILSLFETELNKIFSCYVRLSCPRTRNPQVIAECDEIKEWPLYHQVMKMSGIKLYPFQNYAPKPSQTPQTAAPDAEEITTQRARTWRQRRRRNENQQSQQL